MMGEIFCTAAVKTARFHEIAIALSRSQRTHFVSLSSLLEGRVDIKGEILLRHNMSEIIFSRFRCVSLSFTLTSVPTNHCFHFFLDGCRILTEYPTYGSVTCSCKLSPNGIENLNASNPLVRLLHYGSHGHLRLLVRQRRVTLSTLSQ